MMRKVGSVSLLVVTILFMAGCKPEEQSTAAYMGLEGSYLKTVVYEEDSKIVGYNIEAVLNNNGRVNKVGVTVADKIYPPISNQYQVSNAEIIHKSMVKMSQYPLTFTESFPGKAGVLKTGIAYEGPSGELKPCISVADDTTADVYCGGYGLVQSVSKWEKAGMAKAGKIELVYFEKLSATKGEDFLPSMAAQINAAYAMLLPAADVEAYKSWVRACPEHVETADLEKLDPLAYSFACSCVFKKERDNVQTIIEYPDSPNPLGNGEDAEKFYATTLQCVGASIKPQARDALLQE